MAVVQNSVAARNARIAAFETTLGTTPVLRIFDGTMPANCAAADAGTILAEINLPSDWLGAPSNGSATIAGGPWTDSSANANGTADYYRLYASGGTVCHEQGDVTATGGGGAMTVSNVNFATGQPFSVTGYTRTAGNA